MKVYTINEGAPYIAGQRIIIDTTAINSPLSTRYLAEGGSRIKRYDGYSYIAIWLGTNAVTEVKGEQMKTLPSKELLSAVLGEETEDHIVINNNDLVYAVKENEVIDIRAINIYELIHLMKEWAYTKGYEIKSFKRIGNFKIKGLYTCEVHNGLRRIWDAEYIEETETEAIFKACEWVLKEISK